MTELGQSTDPVALVPGVVWQVQDAVADWRKQSEAADNVRAALSRVSIEDDWSGVAADAFTEKFYQVPRKWAEAAEAFAGAADALEEYSDALRWAQSQAGQAIDLWERAAAATVAAEAAYERDTRTAQSTFDHFFSSQGMKPYGSPPALAYLDPGDAMRAEAEAWLGDARVTVARIADQAADTISAAAQTAPNGPDGWELTGKLIESVWGIASNSALNGAIDAINAIASVGNAMIQHPEYVLEILGGLGAVTLGAGGEVGGIALDATGAGAIAGVPLNIVSAGLIVTGAGAVGAGIIGLANEANGASRVEPLSKERTDGRNDKGEYATGNGGSRSDSYVKEQAGLDEVADAREVEVIRTQVEQMLMVPTIRGSMMGLSSNQTAATSGLRSKAHRAV